MSNEIKMLFGCLLFLESLMYLYSFRMMYDVEKWQGKDTERSKKITLETIMAAE